MVLRPTRLCYGQQDGATANKMVLRPTRWCYGQQDGVTANTAVISIAAFHRLFPQGKISRFDDVPWPPLSPDLTAPDFFLWGYLKSKVYSTSPTDLHALKENIREEIAKRLEETLRAVMRKFSTRVHLCTKEGGGHLKDTVHEK